MAKRWWERWPERLKWELEELHRVNIPYEQDEDALRQGGIIRLRLTPTVGGRALNLVASFPDTYPYLRFEVAAPDLSLERHQDPFAKHLCLVGRGTEQWKRGDSLAAFIVERVPLVLETAQNPMSDAAARAEEHQGEPFTAYYPYQPGAVLLVDSAWSVDPQVVRGELVVGVEFMPDIDRPLRGAVLAVLDEHGTTLTEFDPMVAKNFPHRLRGRWVRRTEPIREQDPWTFLEVTSGGNAQSLIKWQPSRAGAHLAVLGVLSPTEVQWRQTKDAWTFVVIRRHGGSSSRSRRAYFCRAEAAGRADLQARVPALAPLSKKTVAVVGAGCLGAPSAMDLARAGIGELRILDGDYLSAGTVVRWPFGFSVVGADKAPTLASIIAHDYPYTRAVPYNIRIGSVPRYDIIAPMDSLDYNVLERALEGADLLYDATAERGIQHLLSDLAKERGIPYVFVETRPGAWGGLIARVVPGRTDGCWMCVQQALVSGDVPSPVAETGDDVQPFGCADPTFRGAAFDTTQIAMAGVRLAVSTLCADVEDAYPDVDWDIGVVNLRSDKGGATAPTWDTRRLSRDPLCPACRANSGR